MHLSSVLSDNIRRLQQQKWRYTEIVQIVAYWME